MVRAQIISVPTVRRGLVSARNVGARSVSALIIRVLMVVSMCVVAVVCGIPGPAASAEVMTAVKSQVVFVSPDEQLAASMLNQFRAERGLPSLVVTPDLTKEAQDWVAGLVEGNRLGHDPALGSNSRTDWERLGENVGRGPDLAMIMEGFKGSPSHLANLLDPAFDSVGVAVLRAPDGRMYVVQRFQETIDTVAPGVARPTDNRAPVKLAAKVRVRRVAR